MLESITVKNYELYVGITDNGTISFLIRGLSESIAEVAVRIYIEA